MTEPLRLAARRVVQIAYLRADPRPVTWDERQRLVGKPAYDELEQRYAT